MHPLDCPYCNDIQEVVEDDFDASDEYKESDCEN